MKILQVVLPKLENLALTEQVAYFMRIGKTSAEDYARFAEKYGYASPTAFTEILQSLDAELEDIQVDAHFETLDKLAPDLEEFPGNAEASAALDACAFMAEVLEYLQDRDSGHLSVILESALRSSEASVEERLNLDPNISEAERERIFEQESEYQERFAQLSAV